MAKIFSKDGDMWWKKRRQITPPLTGEALHAEVRRRAQLVVAHDLQRDDFLFWLHETVGHEGPEEYQDLVEMDCIPPLADAGAGRWWRESAEAEPLRMWADAAIRGLARGHLPAPLPQGWDDIVRQRR